MEVEELLAVLIRLEESEEEITSLISTGLIFCIVNAERRNSDFDYLEFRKRQEGLLLDNLEIELESKKMESLERYIEENLVVFLLDDNNFIREMARIIYKRIEEKNKCY